MKVPGQLSSLGEKMQTVPWGWLTAIVACLITFAIGMGTIQGPWQQRRRQLQARYEEEWRRQELLVALHTEGNRIVQQEKTVLLQVEAPVFTSEVTRLAAEAGLQIDSVVPQTNSSLGPYKRSQIQVVSTTRFSSLLKFLRSLEQHSPFFRVERLDLTRGPGSSNQHEAELLISSFSRQGATP